MSDADKFAKGVKRISKEIETFSKGGDREELPKIFKSIARLEDLTNSGELRGSPENDGRWEACKALRQAARASEESAHQARQASRNIEIARLTTETRQAGYNQPYGDVGYGNKYRVRKG